MRTWRNRRWKGLLVVGDAFPLCHLFAVTFSLASSKTIYAVSYSGKKSIRLFHSSFFFHLSFPVGPSIYDFVGHHRRQMVRALSPISPDGGEHKIQLAEADVRSGDANRYEPKLSVFTWDRHERNLHRDVYNNLYIYHI